MDPNHIKVTFAHEQDETLHQIVLYPEHAQRTESEEFRRNKHELVHGRDEPCWISGSREKREVHHFFEWSLWNSLDPVKVLEVLKMLNPYGYPEADYEKPIESPDDIRNLVVLSEEYHRGPYKGVHMITFPIWIAQKAVKDGVQITETEKEHADHQESSS